MLDEENEIEVTEEVMPLLDRLKRCRSREAARKSIAEFCEDIGVETSEYHLTVEETTLFSSLK